MGPGPVYGTGISIAKQNRVSGGSRQPQPADCVRSWHSSDNGGKVAAVVRRVGLGRSTRRAPLGPPPETRRGGLATGADHGVPATGIARTLERSEEHTSELQS